MWKIIIFHEKSVSIADTWIMKHNRNQISYKINCEFCNKKQFVFQWNHVLGKSNIGK